MNFRASHVKLRHELIKLFELFELKQMIEQSLQVAGLSSTQLQVNRKLWVPMNMIFFFKNRFYI